MRRDTGQVFNFEMLYQRPSHLTDQHCCPSVITGLDPVISSSTVLEEMAGSGTGHDGNTVISKSRTTGRLVLLTTKKSSAAGDKASNVMENEYDRDLE